MCPRSLIRIFGSKILSKNQYEHRICNVLSLEDKALIYEGKESRLSSNLDWIDDCIFSLCSDKYKQNTQYLYWASTLPVKYQSSRKSPSHQFFLRCSNHGLGSTLVNMSLNCLVVEILSNLIPCFTTSSQNHILYRKMLTWRSELRC